MTDNKLVSTFEFNNDFLHVYTINNTSPWFRANEVAQFLSIKNIRDKLTLIKDEHRPVFLTDTSVGKRECTFINESAFYEIIFSMRIPRNTCDPKYVMIKKFKEWMFEEVLPTIRKTGSFVSEDRMIEHKEKTQKLRIETYNVVYNVFKDIGMDDRDLLMFKDHGRDLLINDNSRGLQECSISKRIQDRYGLLLQKKQLITLGKDLASEYRLLNNKEPLKREQYVNGTVRMVNHYTIEDFEQWGDKVIDRYFYVLNSSKNNKLLKKSADQSSLSLDEEEWLNYTD